MEQIPNEFLVGFLRKLDKLSDSQIFSILDWRVGSRGEGHKDA